NKYTMKSKKERLSAILTIVQTNSVNNQEDLLQLLKEKGFDITQATLSRDIKELKIGKAPDAAGNYKYVLSEGASANTINTPKEISGELISAGFMSLAFSDKLAVIKTRPGYAMGIASDIDNQVSHAILGTIAGDDTILLIPKEGFSKEEIIEALTVLIPRTLLINE
ncbi:MAG: ArgR family transcriptional regulator, partial [Bacteroidales bacterium]|nr:ArgR family transcriptional regulator [Bacteroidales bacterium]